MTAKIFDPLEEVDAPPAKAGTPNIHIRLGKLEADIQRGMQELEGMLK